MPTTLAAGVLAIALVPGLVFLRLTATRRLPRRDEGLHLFLEAAGIGLATSGVSFAVVALIKTQEVRESLQDPLASDDRLSQSAWLVMATLGLALVFAAVWAWLFCQVVSDEYVPSVWQEVLKPDPKSFRVVAIETRDGRRVEGILRAYDFHSDGRLNGRAIALRSPIRITSSLGEVVEPDIDRYVIAEQDVLDFRVKYI